MNKQCKVKLKLSESGYTVKWAEYHHRRITIKAKYSKNYNTVPGTT